MSKRGNLVVSLLVFLCAPGCSSSKMDKQEPASPETEEAPPVNDPVTEVLPPLKPYDLSEEQQRAVFDSPIKTIQGEETTLRTYRGKTLLIVNVASECGLTPQYEQLQSLQEQYAARGFSVIGFPCNQFGGQEPGSAEDILSFGKEKFAVTFPLMAKIEVNGENQHPIYQALTTIKDAKGSAGDVEWNFEKFLLSADGEHVTRIRPETRPDDLRVLELLRPEP